MKILLDSNAIDKIGEHLDFIESRKDIDFYVCREVVGEVHGNGNYNPTNNIISLLKSGVKYLPNSVFVLNHSVLDGESSFGSNESHKVYYDILNASKNNIADAIIASTAYQNNCIVLTYDKGFYKKMKQHKYNVVTFEELQNIALTPPKSALSN